MSNDAYFERREAMLHEALVRVMSDKMGRVLVSEVLQYCGVDGKSFSPDPVVMAHNEGVRDVGIWLTSLIKSRCHELFLTMLNEERTNNVRRDNETD